MEISPIYDRSLFHSVTKTRILDLKRWCNIRPNFNETEVRSCRDAVRFRDRLGSGDQGGVPLWVELKSQIYLLKKGPQTICLVTHTRAINKFNDLAPILESLNIDLDYQVNLILDEIADPKATQSDSPLFGLVNPLNVDILLQSEKLEIDTLSIYQVFDSVLLQSIGHPNTVTTNAGIRSKYIEINPADLIDCTKHYFPNTFVFKNSSLDPIWLGLDGEFVKDEWKRFPLPGPKIGILTGNGPESGLALWQDFLGKYHSYYDSLSDVLMPEIMLHSLPQMGLSMELRARDHHVWQAMKEAIQTLLKAGCTLITIACNTTIYYEPNIKKLCEPYGARFVSIAEACLPAIQKHLTKENQSVGLVGIGTVIDLEGGFSGYKSHLEEIGAKVTPCDAENLAYEIKRIGGSSSQIDRVVTLFRALMNTVLAKEEVVLLALTEVSLVYRRHIEKLPKKYKSKKTFIDPVDELSTYLVYLYIFMGMQQSEFLDFPAEFDLETKVTELIYDSIQVVEVQAS